VLAVLIQVSGEVRVPAGARAVESSPPPP
jgi:hypothetical protein